jgi:hypothetical protein
MNLENQQALYIRIVELPVIRMARSGKSDLDAFNTWWSGIAAQDTYSLFPRDFMWFNKELNCFEWLYALPAGVVDTNGYEVFDFPGGMYAVATCIDGEEITRTNAFMHEWIAQSDSFEESPLTTDGRARYDMGHIVTPRDAMEKLGYHQMDLFVPIAYKP